MYCIDFHADDYAASVENSKRILELIRAGRVDSISILTNMGCYKECMKLLKEAWPSLKKKPLLSLHINLIDGHWLSARRGSEHIIHNSWEKIFLHSAIPGGKKKKLKKAFSAEIAAQLSAFRDETAKLTDDEGKALPLRIDSHVHTHMIPLVYDSLMEALERSGLKDEVRFIRCSTEPLAMFLFTPGITGTITPINLFKNITLHFLSHTIRKKLGKLDIETGRLFGVAMTGHMDETRVAKLLPKMEKYAKKKDCRLEILSHPGRVSEKPRPEYGPDDIKAFYSADRDLEYTMLISPEIPRG